MASIRPNDPRHPGPFRIDFKHTNRDGTQVRGSLTRNSWYEAQTAAGDAERDIRDGCHPYDRYDIAPAREVLTVGRWIDRWRVGRGLGDHADEVEQSIVKLYILPRFSATPLAGESGDRLSRLAVQQWVNWLEADGNAPWYVRRIYGVLRKIVSDAVDDPTVALDATPCVRIQLPALEPSDRRDLTIDEVAAICSRCGDYEWVAWTLFFGGMRIGELLKRDVGDWSPFTGITIAGKPIAEARAKGKRKAKTRASKTVAGGRTVPLCASHGRLIRDELGGRATGPLVVDGRGERLTYWSFWKVWDTARAGAGLPDVTPHWARHTFKTWLRDGGCDPRAVDTVTGHATPGMDRIYVHPTAAMLKVVTDVLEAKWVAAHASPTAGTATATRRG
jgi:integrase